MMPGRCNLVIRLDSSVAGAGLCAESQSPEPERSMHASGNSRKLSLKENIESLYLPLCADVLTTVKIRPSRGYSLSFLLERDWMLSRRVVRLDCALVNDESELLLFLLIPPSPP